MRERSNMRGRLRRRVAGGAAALAIAAGAVLAGASPAQAAITPYWGMNCNTAAAGSFGSYYGWASCTGTGVWAVEIDCSFGGTYRSLKVIQIEQTEIASVGSCYWGVNSVSVVEFRS